MKWEPLFIAILIIVLAVIGARVIPGHSPEIKSESSSDSSIKDAVKIIIPKK